MPVVRVCPFLCPWSAFETGPEGPELEGGQLEIKSKAAFDSIMLPFKKGGFRPFGACLKKGGHERTKQKLIERESSGARTMMRGSGAR